MLSARCGSMSILSGRHGPRGRAEPSARAWGPHVGEIRHKAPIGAWDGGFALGLDPARGDYASSANFSDPDGATAGCYRNGATAVSEVLLMVGRCRVLDLIPICSGSRYKNGTSS